MDFTMAMKQAGKEEMIKRDSSNDEICKIDEN